MSHELLFIVAGVLATIQGKLALIDPEYRALPAWARTAATPFVIAINIVTLELLRWLGGMVGG